MARRAAAENHCRLLAGSSVVFGDIAVVRQTSCVDSLLSWSVSFGRYVHVFLVAVRAIGSDERIDFNTNGTTDCRS